MDAAAVAGSCHASKFCNVRESNSKELLDDRLRVAVEHVRTYC